MDLDKSYETLGIKPGSTDDEIKVAYRKLAKEWHPDINDAPEATDKFKEIQAAYETVMRSKQTKFFDPFDNPFGFRRHNINNIWESFFSAGSNGVPNGKVRIDLEFDKLSHDDSEKLLKTLRDAGFDFKRYSITRST